MRRTSLKEPLSLGTLTRLKGNMNRVDSVKCEKGKDVMSSALAIADEKRLGLTSILKAFCNLESHDPSAAVHFSKPKGTGRKTQGAVGRSGSMTEGEPVLVAW